MIKPKDALSLALDLGLVGFEQIRALVLAKLEPTQNLHWAAYCGANAQLRAAQKRELVAHENYAMAARDFQAADERARGLQKAFESLVDRPSLAADCVVIAEGCVLLVRRGDDPHKGKWALPGGFGNTGETLRDTALRELREETAFAGVSARLIGVYDAPNRDPRGRVISVAYGMSLPKKVPVAAGDDAEETEWVDLELLQKDDLAFDHARILDDALGML